MYPYFISPSRATAVLEFLDIIRLFDLSAVGYCGQRD